MAGRRAGRSRPVRLVSLNVTNLRFVRWIFLNKIKVTINHEKQIIQHRSHLSYRGVT
jgi:hypothetical protein